MSQPYFCDDVIGISNFIGTGTVALFFNTESSNLSLYLLYYAKACNELARPISASLHLRTTQLYLKKCHSCGEPFATLRAI